MIKINLLAGERKAVKKKTSFVAGQQMAIGCGLILAASVGFIVWRYTALSRQSASIDAEIATAQLETARLHTVISQVQQFEQRKAQLQQRVSLIEQLRKDQTGPVHMLDELSRALPPMLWLTNLKQTASAGEVVIEGRCTTLTGLSDFVANLEATGYFKKSVEIVSTAVDAQEKTGELIKFSVKAQFQTSAPVVAAVGAPARTAPASGTKQGD
jgi:type IV pilus assembly protein PilN